MTDGGVWADKRPHDDRTNDSARRESQATPEVLIQPKLIVGSVADPAEAEADRVADFVMRAIVAPGATPVDDTRIRRASGSSEDLAGAPGEGSQNPLSRVAKREWPAQMTTAPPTVRRRGEFADKRVQRSQTSVIGADGGTVGAEIERSISRARGAGQPLDSGIRDSMENAIGADFSGIRVHVGAESDHLNRSIQSKAFTTGSDIFVRQQDYAPSTPEGQRLLAHELVHTIQQGAAPTRDTSAQRTAVDVREHSDGDTVRRLGDGAGHERRDRVMTPRRVPRLVTAHDLALVHRTTDRTVIRRLPDPLAPSVLMKEGGAQLDAAKFKDFKHYLGTARGLIEAGPSRDAWVAAYQVWNQAKTANPADPALPGLLTAVNDAQVAYEATSQSFVSLRRGMPAGQAAKYKMAIKELQRKLIAALGGRVRSGIFKRDGVYGKSTEKAVKRFQHQSTLNVTGQCDIHTWQALDVTGAAASRGRAEYRWEEEHEEAAETAAGGSGVFAMASAVDWAKKNDELVVNVSYQFDLAKGANPAAPNIARQAIKDTWNQFDIKYKGPKDAKRRKRRPRNPLIKLTFNPVDSAVVPAGGVAIKGDQRVLLFSTPHPNWANRGFPDEAHKKSRSDAGSWNVDDIPTLKGIAGHEFGHAIGLEDEYGRRHKDMTRIAGPVPAYKEVNTAATVQWFKDKIDAATTVHHLKGIGLKTAALDDSVRPVIAQKYRDTHGSKLVSDLRVQTAAVAGGWAVKKGAAASDWRKTSSALDGTFKAGKATDDLATKARAAAARADRRYARQLQLAGVRIPLQEIRGSLAHTQHQGDGAFAQKGIADTARDAAQLGTLAKSAVAKKTSRQAAKMSERSAKRAGQAVAAATKAQTALSVAATQTLTQRRAERDAKRDDLDDARDLSAHAREDLEVAQLSREAAEMSQLLLAGLARQRAVAAGELADPHVDPTVSARLAEDLAQDIVDLAGMVLATAIDAARVAGRAATRTGRSKSVAIATGAANVGAVGAESARTTAWHASTSALATLSAQRWSYEQAADRELYADWDGTSRADLWHAAHIAGFSSGSLMGREHGQNKADGPALDHSHPLQPRHVRRFAEFVMKYKPDDIWEIAHR